MDDAEKAVELLADVSLRPVYTTEAIEQEVRALWAECGPATLNALVRCLSD
jgi:predicted Zn-dependent peptidase